MTTQIMVTSMILASSNYEVSCGDYLYSLEMPLLLLNVCLDGDCMIVLEANWDKQSINSRKYRSMFLFAAYSYQWKCKNALKCN